MLYTQSNCTHSLSSEYPRFVTHIQTPTRRGVGGIIYRKFQRVPTRPKTEEKEKPGENEMHEHSLDNPKESFVKRKEKGLTWFQASCRMI
jgi:hypothetical protein